MSSLNKPPQRNISNQNDIETIQHNPEYIPEDQEDIVEQVAATEEPNEVRDNPAGT